MDVKNALRLLVFVLLLGQITSASAASFPERPVRILVGFPVGTSIDIVCRLVAQKLGEQWGQSVVVDNRPGAGGNVAGEIVAKARADGHTLLIGNNAYAISATLYRKLPYAPGRDLRAVSQFTALPHVIVVTNSLPANSLKELIAFAKAKPGQLNYGSGGVGNSDHMAAELFKYMADVNIVHVPYKGGTLAMGDVMTGQVAMYFSGVPAAMGLIKAGKLKALGTTGSKRSPALPDLPTFAETLPGYEVILWHGLMAPAGTPKAVMDKIAADSIRALKLPDVQERLGALGFDAVGSTPPEFERFFQSEIAKWGKVITTIGLTAD